eukprot:scaffold434157_cov46-Prasinocladus_malaysianus.AAC.1
MSQHDTQENHDLFSSLGRYSPPALIQCQCVMAPCHGVPNTATMPATYYLATIASPNLNEA